MPKPVWYLAKMTWPFDLGCGPGFQSLALARMGYRVLAIDLSEQLLAELTRSAADLPIQTIHDDLLHFERHLDLSPSLIVCMGDTITHLDSSRPFSCFCKISTLVWTRRAGWS